MILRCIVCGNERHAHDSSLHVQETLCALHNRSAAARNHFDRRPLPYLPVKTFTEALAVPYKGKPRFRTHFVTAAAS